jgi:hypothetical protein|tara:strand:+ start:1887 stop:2693 length:807 start_codon:yes stop_codon:yes gene_type:complete
MINGRYYSTKIRPEIPASKQNAAAFSNNDVLFPWTAVEIPKGSAKLISATAIVRAKGDDAATANPFAFDIWFADDDRVALSAANDVLTPLPSRDILGVIEMPVAGYKQMGANTAVSVCTNGPAATEHDNLYLSGQKDLVITPKMSLDVNTTPAVQGYSTFYMGAVAKGAFDFRSINAINESGDAEAASTEVITMDGTDMETTFHFTADDTVHIGTSAGTPAADSRIGKIKTVASTTSVTLTTTAATALVDGDILYNIHPIEIILAFEY